MTFAIVIGVAGTSVLVISPAMALAIVIDVAAPAGLLCSPLSAVSLAFRDKPPLISCLAVNLPPILALLCSLAASFRIPCGRLCRLRRATHAAR